MPVYQIQTFKMPAFGTGSDTSKAETELVDIIEFELSNAPQSETVFAILEAYHAEDAGTYDTVFDILEPASTASSVLDRPDVKILFS